MPDIEPPSKESEAANKKRLAWIKKNISPVDVKVLKSLFKKKVDKTRIKPQDESTIHTAAKLLVNAMQ